MGIMSNVYLGNSLYKYLLYIGIILGGVVVGKIVEFIIDKVLKKLAKKTKSKYDDIVIAELDKVIFNFIVVMGVYFAAFALNLSDAARGYYVKFIKILFIFVLTKFLLSFWQSIVDKLLKPVVAKTENDMDDIILPVLSKTVRVLIIIMSVIMVLSDLGFNVFSFVAGLGIIGMAIALASKDFVANIFGAFSIYSDKMFKIDDTIKVKGEEGKVIEIGLRSVKILKDDGSVVILPGSLMTKSPVQNKDYGKKSKKKK